MLDWSATTNEARTRNVKVTRDLPGGDFFWVGVIQPGAVQSFEVVVPVAALKSDRDNFTRRHARGTQGRHVHPNIVFTLTRMEKKAGGAMAFGTLDVAGVEKEISLDLLTSLRDGKLLVKGSAGSVDDRLRHRPADRDDGRAEDRPEGHHQVRDDARQADDLVTATH